MVAYEQVVVPPPPLPPLPPLVVEVGTEVIVGPVVGLVVGLLVGAVVVTPDVGQEPPVAPAEAQSHTEDAPVITAGIDSPGQPVARQVTKS